MERKLKHLELTQGVINRLSRNSFLLKGWSIVLVSALLALSTPNADEDFILLAFIPAIILWGLDGYFLWQEKRYRDLYNVVRTKKPDDIDFSMDAKGVSNETWLGAVFSKTLIPFHGVLIGAIFAFMFIVV